MLFVKYRCNPLSHSCTTLTFEGRPCIRCLAPSILGFAGISGKLFTWGLFVHPLWCLQEIISRGHCCSLISRGNPRCMLLCWLQIFAIPLVAHFFHSGQARSGLLLSKLVCIAFITIGLPLSFLYISKISIPDKKIWAFFWAKPLCLEISFPWEVSISGKTFQCLSFQCYLAYRWTNH